jgi:hypothetical protein
MLRLAVRVSAARAAPALVHGVGAVAPRFARMFSAQDASHDDFKPKLKVDVKDGDAVQRAIDAVRAMVTGKTSANVRSRARARAGNGRLGRVRRTSRATRSCCT